MEPLTLAKVGVPLLVVFLGATGWFISFLLQRLTDALIARIDRLQVAVERESERVTAVEKQVLELRAQLPEQYVRREDWIRFSAVIDAKLETNAARLTQVLERLPKV